MSHSTPHIIEQPRPLRKAIIVLLIVALSAGGQWLFLRNELNKQQQKIAELSQQIESLNEENRRLEEIATLSPRDKSDLAIEKETNAQLQLRLEEQDKKILAQTKDLLFYESITQGASSSKLQIKELVLTPDKSEADTTRYRLVITQGKKITAPIQGDIKITLNAEKNKKIIEHPLGEHKLNMRHVQVIEGQIRLNSDTVPKTITIDLIQNHKVVISKTFEWQITP